MCLTVQLYNVASQFADHDLEACTNSMPFFSYSTYQCIELALHCIQLTDVYYLLLKQEVARVVGHFRRFLRFAESKDVLSLSNAFSFNPA